MLETFLLLDLLLGRSFIIIIMRIKRDSNFPTNGMSSILQEHSLK